VSALASGSTHASAGDATGSDAAWPEAGSRSLLVLAGLVVATSIILDRFPEMTSDLVSRLIDTSAPSGHEMHRPQKGSL
jgi:hypothetical protein